MYKGDYQSKYKGELHFTSSNSLENLKKLNWDIGISYNIEFFDGILSQVILLDTDSDISQFIKKISFDKTIFADFEYVLPARQKKLPPEEQNGIPKICLFSFCCTSGVYIFKQTNTVPNNQLKQFLSAKNGRKFIGINTEGVVSRLHNFFDKDFKISLEDVAKSYLDPKKEPSSFYEIIVKYVGEPLAKFNCEKIKNTNWSKPNMKMAQIITLAFKVFALSLFYKNHSKLNSNISKTQEPIKEKIIKKGKLQLSNKQLEKIKEKWEIGECYNIEFFKNNFTPVYLLNASSNITEYLQRISSDSVIFVDFKYVQQYIFKSKLTPAEQKKVPLICLFSFCCSSGVYLFKQVNKSPNNELKEFLSSKNGLKFVGINTEGYLKRLQKFFAPKFSVNIEDIAQTRLSAREDPSNFYEIVIKYAKKPEAEFNRNIKNTIWSYNPLNMKFIIYAAFKVFALSFCYEKLPQKKINLHMSYSLTKAGLNYEDIPSKSRSVVAQSSSSLRKHIFIQKKGEIHFTPDFDFDNYDEWLIGNMYNVEFFAGRITKVLLLDANSDISKYIKKMMTDTVIFLDLKYSKKSKNTPEISLFQFCSSAGAYIFKQTQKEPNDQMKNFMRLENKVKFVGKGINGYVQRLKNFFGDDFLINIEDIELTRLIPYKYSTDFDAMVLKFASKPEVQFDDQNINKLDWNSKNYSMKQIIFAAFNVVALYHCYQNFQPRQSFMFIPSTNKENCKTDIKKKLYNFAIKNKDEINLTSDLDQESVWNSHYNYLTILFNADINLIKNAIFESMWVNPNHKFVCKICTDNEEYSTFADLLNHYRKNHYNSKVKITNKNGLKPLLMSYLNKTGRIIIEKKFCALCDSTFETDSEIRVHCWNYHYNLLNEILDTKIKSRKDIIYEIDDYEEDEELEESNKAKIKSKIKEENEDEYDNDDDDDYEIYNKKNISKLAKTENSNENRSDDIIYSSDEDYDVNNDTDDEDFSEPVPKNTKIQENKDDDDEDENDEDEISSEIDERKIDEFEYVYDENDDDENPVKDKSCKESKFASKKIHEESVIDDKDEIEYVDEEDDDELPPQKIFNHNKSKSNNISNRKTQSDEDEDNYEFDEDDAPKRPKNAKINKKQNNKALYRKNTLISDDDYDNDDYKSSQQKSINRNRNQPKPKPKTQIKDNRKGRNDSFANKSDDEIPPKKNLYNQNRNKNSRFTNKQTQNNKNDFDDDNENDDSEFTSTNFKQNKNKKLVNKKPTKSQIYDDDDDEDEIIKPKSRIRKILNKKDQNKINENESDDDDDGYAINSYTKQPKQPKQQVNKNTYDSDFDDYEDEFEQSFKKIKNKNTNSKIKITNKRSTNNYKQMISDSDEDDDSF